MKLMTWGPSGGTSLARGGSFARPATVKRCRRGPEPRVSHVLRLIRFAIAIATVIVCAGIGGPARASASLLAVASDLAASETADDQRGALPSERFLHGQDDVARGAADLEAVELDDDDDDDDDDPRWDVLDAAALSFRCVAAPARPDRALRREVPIDPSRFAAGTGLPRGPPA